MPWQSEAPTPSRLPGAGCPTQDPQTAPGASGGTAAPGTPDPYAVPSLTDKAPGIYETLGPNGILLPIVRAAGQTASTATDIASAFAGLLIDPDVHDLQPGIRMSWLANSLNHLCEYVGNLLACMDIVIAASGYSTSPADRAEDVRRSYYLQYVLLLREAEQKGLSPDYTSAPMREARRRDCGLRRPDVAKGGNKNT